MTTSTQSSFKNFTDLLAWQEGHKLALLIYRQTESLPHAEKFNLITQIQRATVSVTSNIAEGFSRRTYRDKISFFYIALASLREVQNQLLICKDLQYIDESAYNACENQLNLCLKLLIGLTKSYETKVISK